MGVGKTSAMMIKTHGSIDVALLSCKAEGLGSNDIAKRFGSTQSNISNMARRRGIVLPAMDRDEVLKIARKAKGSHLLSMEAEKKELTNAYQRGQEINSAILAAQVTTYTPDHPEFDAVVADIAEQRSRCKKMAFTHHLWRE